MTILQVKSLILEIELLESPGYSSLMFISNLIDSIENTAHHTLVLIFRLNKISASYDI